MNWDHSRVIGFDVETSGTKPDYALQPWRVASGDAWITTSVWRAHHHGSWGSNGQVMPVANDLREMLDFAIQEKRTIVGWNVQFDIQWLIAYGLEDLVFRCRWLDGMLLWKHYDVDPEYDVVRARKRSYGLKACVAEHLPEFAGYEIDVNYHSTDPDELARLIQYNEIDVAATMALAKKWFNKLSKRQRQAALIEAASIPHVALANLRGLPVDVIATAELQARLRGEAAEALRALEPHGATAKVLASPKQLGDLMFKRWGLRPLGKTATGADSTGKETLHELSFDDERVETVKAFRDANNNRAKFADNPLASALYNGDGATHPQARMFGTYSGRMTYSSDQRGREVNPKTKKERYVKLPTGFAIHQIKRGAEYRSILCVPRGYRMVEFDAASQEFRWMAIASGDETMLKLCQPGEDAHGFMGAQIAGVDYKELVARVHAKEKVAKAQRQLGKIANLSLQYRTNPKRLLSVARVQYGLPMDLDEATTIYETYHKAYPGVRDYWDAQINLVREQGYVETFAGRRVAVEGDWFGSLGWSMGSTAINYRIQGTGADQKYLALAAIGPHLRATGARFALDLHDGLTFFVPDSIADEWAKEMKWVLDNLDYEDAWGFDPPVPMPFDCKMGYSFGGMEEVQF